MAGYRTALQVREFRGILAAYLISVLGDTCAYLAVTVLIYQRSRSPLLSSLTFAVAFTPQILGGTLLSGLVDRLRPKSILVGFDIAAAGLVCLMLIPRTPIAGLYGVLIVIGTLSPVRSGTLQAVVADALPGDAYVAGRSAMRIVVMTAQVVGLGFAGALVSTIGPRGALTVDVGSFLASAAVGLINLKPRAARGAQGNLLLDSLRGVGAVWRQREPRRLLLLSWLLLFVAVAPEGLGAVAVAQSGHSLVLVGVWMGVIPAGVVVGDLIAVALLSPRLRQRLVVPLATALGLALLAFALQPPLPIALALLTVSGLSAAWSPGVDQQLREATDPALLRRTLTVNQAGTMVIQGLGFAAAGSLGEVMSANAAIAVTGAVGLISVIALGRPAASERTKTAPAPSEAGAHEPA
jgi:MFS family permease